LELRSTPPHGRVRRDHSRDAGAVTIAIVAFRRPSHFDRKDTQQMSPLWDADVELSDTAAARLIETQFPSLRPALVERIGVGWDNTAYRVNARFVFRFPRRRIAADLIEHEVAALPILAPHLPVSIPIPEFVGMPEDDYPYPFVGYPRIAGTTACHRDLTDDVRAANAVPLAG
jgi:aminoglycoside phosphotransferase (APT) family kinase protein